ncbi:hypothetical protein H1R20_g7791, partial [Candolleomyces eurysporus]
MEITPGPQPGSSQPRGLRPTTPTLDNGSILTGNETVEDVLPKDWETLSITERIQSLTELYDPEDPEGNVKHAAIFASLAAVLYRNSVPGSKVGKPLESPHDFGIMLQEWKKCIDDGNEEVLKIATSGTGFQDDGYGGIWGGHSRYDVSACSRARSGGQVTRTDNSREEEAQVAKVDGKGKAKEKVARSPGDTKNGGRLIKLPVGNVKPEELPDDIDDYVMPMNIGPVDRAPLEVKDGKVVEPELIATFVPAGRNPFLKSPKKIVVRPTDDGTGMGVFATRDIKRFEPVLVERPYLVYTRQDAINTFSSKALEELSDAQIGQLLVKNSESFFRYMVDQQMRSDDRKEFMSLANSHTNDGSGPVFGIVRTNGFGIDFGSALPGADKDFGSGYGAVMRIGSRFNHSCIPDVAHKFEPSTFTMRFTAVRDIKKGSQIYTTYTYPNSTKAERQKALIPYGFECTCRACVNATPQTDKLRQVSQNLTQKWRSQAINVWSKDPNLTEKVLIPILETKRRMEKEGLDTEEAGYYTFPEILFRVYQKVGNRAKMEEAKSELLRVAKALAQLQEWGC